MCARVSRIEFCVQRVIRVKMFCSLLCDVVLNCITVGLRMNIQVEARNCAFESLMSQKISMNVSKLRSDLANLHTKTSLNLNVIQNPS